LTRDRKRRARPERTAGILHQPPFRQVRMPYAPVEVLPADRIEAIHEAGLTILEQIGMRILDTRARSLYAAAGAKVDETAMQVRLDRALVMELIAHAPARFTVHARNPARNVTVGGQDLMFAAVGGHAYFADREGVRRPCT